MCLGAAVERVRQVAVINFPVGWPLAGTQGVAVWSEREREGGLCL